MEDGDCEFAEENYDCAGNCTVGEDCLGECSGSAVVDECGVCDGPGETEGCGCEGIPSGACDCDGNIIDECGECGGSGIPNGECDCAGNVEDCLGECGGSAEVDECGECGGDGADVECWDGSYECNASDCPDQPGGSVEVHYNSDTAIAGFQFNVDGVDVTGAGGGAAGDAGRAAPRIGAADHRRLALLRLCPPRSQVGAAHPHLGQAGGQLDRRGGGRPGADHRPPCWPDSGFLRYPAGQPFCRTGAHQGHGGALQQRAVDDRLAGRRRGGAGARLCQAAERRPRHHRQATRTGRRLRGDEHHR